MCSTSLIRLSSYVEYPFQSAFIRLKRRLKGIGCCTIIGWTLTQIGRCCVFGIGSMIDFLHICLMPEDEKIKSGLYRLLPSCTIKAFR